MCVAGLICAEGQATEMDSCHPMSNAPLLSLCRDTARHVKNFLLSYIAWWPMNAVYVEMGKCLVQPLIDRGMQTAVCALVPCTAVPPLALLPLALLQSVQAGALSRVAWILVDAAELLGYWLMNLAG